MPRSESIDGCRARNYGHAIGGQDDHLASFFQDNLRQVIKQVVHFGMIEADLPDAESIRPGIWRLSSTRSCNPAAIAASR